MSKLYNERVYRTNEPCKYDICINTVLEKVEDLCALVKVQEMLKNDYGYADINISLLVYSILQRVGKGEKILGGNNNEHTDL